MRLEIGILACASIAILSGQQQIKRMDNATEVFTEIMATPDKSIPQDLLEKAQCIVIIPDLKKGAFLFGAKYGKGYLFCRRETGVGWGPPGTVRVEGGSFGLQAGGSATDVVLLVMNKRGMERLLSSKFTIGGDVSGAAGPVGRTMSAQTDALMSAEILSWSRSRGAFAGVSLEGATLRQDLDGNNELYSKAYTNRQIMTSGLECPSAAKLVGLLNKYSGRK
jgi:lipid-binding SYLF domain-containing protein